MRPTRPLVVLPAARALLFAGLAPAPADDYERDRDHRLVAEVLDIDEADADARRTRVSVTSDHECRGDERDLVARVALRQDDVRSTGSCARGSRATAASSPGWSSCGTAGAGWRTATRPAAPG